MKNRTHSPRRQQGMTLVIGLIMLIMISLAAVASYQMSKTSTEVVGNMQFQNEALASANATIQEVISTTRLFEAPNTLFLAPCGVQNRRCFDLDGDGAADDMRVDVIPPTCVRATILTVDDLDLTPDPTTLVPLDFGCLTGDQQGLFATGGTPTGETLCADSVWNVEARASELTATTGATVTVTMGAQVQVPKNAIDTSCPL